MSASAQQVGAVHFGRSGECSLDCSRKFRSISPPFQFQKNEIVTLGIEQGWRVTGCKASEGEP